MKKKRQATKRPAPRRTSRIYIALSLFWLGVGLGLGVSEKVIDRQTSGNELVARLGKRNVIRVTYNKDQIKGAIRTLKRASAAVEQGQPVKTNQLIHEAVVSLRHPDP